MSAAGGRRATIIDVASRAGVSRQTVSRAINDLPGISQDTRQRVLSAAEELNYRPSRFGRGLVSAGPPTLGLLVDDLGNAFFPEIARAVIREASTRGWNVVVAEAGAAPDPEAVGRDLARRADALVGYSLPRSTGEAVPARMPLVRLDAPPQERGAGVVFEDSAAIADLGRHLRAQGVRTTAVLDTAAEGPSPRGRRLAEGLAAQGIDVRCVPLAAQGVEGQLAACGGAAPTVDALVCWNDVHALTALKLLTARQVAVPGDVRLVGVDGLALGTLVTPELTTLGVPMDELARAAVDLVEALFGGRLAPDDPDATPSVAYRLMVRGSA